MRRLRCRLKCLLAWAILVAALYFVACLVLPVYIDLRGQDFLESHKCPACYGDSLCPDFYSGHVRLTNWTRYKVSRLVNAKNVYYGDYRGRRVLLKKLAHDWELKALDQSICKLSRRPFPSNDCKPGHHIRYMASDHSVYTNQASSKRTLDSGLLSLLLQKGTPTEFLGCMRSTELLTFLSNRAMAHRGMSKLEHLLTLSLLNPEPLFLMAFPEEEGWPVPKYFGSCGRIAVVEDAGRALTDFYDTPWATRARLSLQLLQMALKFADNSNKLALYLTDWSTDNFAVNDRLWLRLVDLENIVIVNQTWVKDVAAPGWNVAHTSVPFGCKDCFSYSVEDLCSHQISDHNLYGACHGILAPNSFSKQMPSGLLHHIPSNVKTSHPLFERLLAECAVPTHPAGRFEAATQIVEILKQM